MAAHVQCDVLVGCGGPAGLYAARRLAAAALSVPGCDVKQRVADDDGPDPRSRASVTRSIGPYGGNSSRVTARLRVKVSSSRVIPWSSRRIVGATTSQP